MLLSPPNLGCCQSPWILELISTSLGSKEAVSSINNAFKNSFISSLHSGMCKKNKLRVYRDLNARSTYMESLTWVLSFCSDLSGTHGLNKELGRHNTRNSSKVCFFCECESVEHVLWECSEYSRNVY